MIRSLSIGLLVLFQAITAWSKTVPDSLQPYEPTDCEYIAYQSTSLIIKYYKVHDYDSALLVLNDWQTACGESEPITRTRILLAINDHAFDENIYDSTIVDDVLNYMQRIETKSPDTLYGDYKSYFGYVPIRGFYDYFTQSLADSLLKREFDTPLELLFCQFYSNIVNNPVKEIKANKLYSNTAIKSYYENDVKEALSWPGINISFIAGAWIPTGNAALLGNHPLLGAQVGIKVNKMMGNVTLAFKLAHSANSYAIYKDGAIDTTDYFFGGYLGLDFEREILKGKKHELDLLFGIGYDGFESLKSGLENTDTYSGHTISSLNMNAGLGYRYFYKKGKYIGLQAKYNVINYNNSGGTNLMGDCITISLVVGGLSSPERDNRLRDLRYYE
jgi:hypothetical protein